MKDLKIRWMAVAALLVSATLIAGCKSDDHAYGTSTSDTWTSMQTADSRTLAMADASDLIGMDIIGSDNETVGVLDDIVVHRDNGKIAYGVIAYGGLMGLGEDFHAVSWDAFRFREVDGKKILSVNLAEESLEGVKGFSKDSYPLSPTVRAGTTAALDTSGLSIHSDSDSVASASDLDRDFDSDTWSYGYMGDRSDDVARDDISYSSDKLPEALVANGRLVRLAKLVGWDFHHTEGNIGEVEAAMIDVNAGNLAYVVIKFDGTVDALDDRVGLIPWMALTLLPDDTAVALRNTMDADTLVGYTFQRNSVPDLSDRSVAMRLHSQFGVEPYWGTYGFYGDEMRDSDTRMDYDMHRGDSDINNGF